MLRPRVRDEFVAHSGGVHILLECFDRLGLHKGIGLTMGDEDFALDVRRVVTGFEGAGVKGGDRIEVSAGPRHVQNHRAAKAVADGRGLLWIGAGMFIEHLLGCLKARHADIHVPHHFHHELLGVLRMLGLFSIAVHVHCERSVAQLRELTGAISRVVIVPPPLVNHEHTGTRSIVVFVVGDVAFQCHATGLVADLFTDDLRNGRRFRRGRCERLG